MWIRAAVRTTFLFLTLTPLVRSEHEARIRQHFSSQVSESLLAVQNDIVRADMPGGFYDKSYRHAEPFYWWKIPGWMEADSARRRAQRILDVGCGYGTLLAVATRIYGAQGYCLDVTPYLLPPVARRWDLRFAKANLELDPIPWGGSFDVIIMTEVLEHLSFQPAPTLKKLRDALAADGRLFLSTPDAKDWGRTQKYYQRLEEIPQPVRGTKPIDDHVWQYTERELRQVLKDAGLRVEQWDHAPGAGLRHFNLVLRRDR